MENTFCVWQHLVSVKNQSSEEVAPLREACFVDATWVFRWQLCTATQRKKKKRTFWKDAENDSNRRQNNNLMCLKGEKLFSHVDEKMSKFGWKRKHIVSSSTPLQTAQLTRRFKSVSFLLWGSSSNFSTATPPFHIIHRTSTFRLTKKSIIIIFILFCDCLPLHNQI